LNGRRGDDILRAADDLQNHVVCADGTDSATVDALDHVSASCETVTATT